jgi:hypothetical protein
MIHSKKRYGDAIDFVRGKRRLTPNGFAPGLVVPNPNPFGVRILNCSPVHPGEKGEREKRKKRVCHF